MSRQSGAQSTEWKRSMQKILIGTFLLSVPFTMFGLHEIFSLVALFLMMLGYRKLIHENRWFSIGYILTILFFLYVLFVVLFQTTIAFRSSFSLEDIARGYNLALLFYIISYVCLWKGIKAVCTKIERNCSCRSILALIVWYFFVFGNLLQSSTAVFLLWIIACILYIPLYSALHKRILAIDTAGFMLAKHVYRCSDRWLMAGLVAVLVIGGTCGYCLNDGYAMQWEKKEALQDQEAQTIRLQLLELDFPTAVLDDLTKEDLLACKGAERLIVVTHDYTFGVDDQKEELPKDLRITDVALQLKDAQNWVIFHHFQWLEADDFYGTESIQLLETNDLGLMDLYGQVLYDEGDSTYTAPFALLGKTSTIISDASYLNPSVSDGYMGGFSFPSHKENYRGYLRISRWIDPDDQQVLSTINYTHQKSWMQYPMITASEHQLIHNLKGNAAFETIQDHLLASFDEEQLSLYTDN